MQEPLRAEPAAQVLAAFGATGTPTPISGGRGTSWRCGAVVLKPLDTSPDLLSYQAEFVPKLQGNPDFRVAAPLRSQAGALIVDGWTGRPFLDGVHRPGSWAAIVEVGALLHQATSEFTKQNVMDERDDAWSIGDRVAWGELSLNGLDRMRHLPDLFEALDTVTAPSQLIHGDLTGNVLFDTQLPPAIIDLSMYWRPPAFASAIVVADALAFEGATASLLSTPAIADVEDFVQYLLRALIYRIATDHVAGVVRSEADDPYLPAVQLALDLAR